MITRRRLLSGGAGAAGLGLLGACTRDRTPALVTPSSRAVAAAEAARHPGAIRSVGLVATKADVDLGGIIAATWTYGGTVPGRVIRVTAGEQIKAVVRNELPDETTVHWHGVALRNDADGVPHVTQAPIRAGDRFTYQFTAARPGTYWFHPHTGVQLDRGLYAPLIVEDPHEPVSYDDEWIVVLDDWLDGVAGTPDDQLAALKRGMADMMSGGHMMGMTSALLGGDAGDVNYPHYLINGRLPTDPDVHTGRPGQRVRIRFINAAADTAFRVAIGGHQLTVTHTDGFPIVPKDTDALLLGMGERYDVVVTLGDGVFPLAALAEGKNAMAYAVIRTGVGALPVARLRLPELDRRIVAYRQLKADASVMLPTREPTRTIRLALTGGMMHYDWRFDGRTFEHTRVDHTVAEKDRVRIDFVNTTVMWHPVHLHGHTFAISSAAGPRKDTAIVPPGQTLTTLFDADNPGQWMIHCHNAYHAEAGMMTLLGYLA